MQETIPRLALGLACVMASNILLGSAGAQLCGGFDRKKLLRGAQKAALVLIGTLFMYAAAVIAPNIVVLEAAEASMTLMDGLHVMMLGGFVFYAAQTLSKLAQIIGIKISGISTGTLSTDGGESL